MTQLDQSLLDIKMMMRPNQGWKSEAAKKGEAQERQNIWSMKQGMVDVMKMEMNHLQVALANLNGPD